MDAAAPSGGALPLRSVSRSASGRSDNINQSPSERSHGQPAHIDRPVTDETYIELVRSVFANLVPTAIMGILFVLVAGMALRSMPDPILMVVGISGSVVALVRVAVLLRWEAMVTRPEVDAATARRAERQFGGIYLAFATLLGLFAGRAFQVSSTEVQIVVGPLVVGYAAGVAAGMSLRPGSASLQSCSPSCPSFQLAC